MGQSWEKNKENKEKREQKERKKTYKGIKMPLVGRGQKKTGRNLYQCVALPEGKNHLAAEYILRLTNATMKAAPLNL